VEDRMSGVILHDPPFSQKFYRLLQAFSLGSCSERVIY
jgi:hypothetical protein